MKTFAAAAVLIAAVTPALAEPGVEHWVAGSTTAMGITGDITLSPTRITMAGKTLPLAVAADVPGFKTDTGTATARVLKVTRPADPVLLHANRMCGGLKGPGEPVRWIAVWRETMLGEAKPGLGMAVFSGAEQPKGEGSPGLCGTFYFSRP